MSWILAVSAVLNTLCISRIFILSWALYNHLAILINSFPPDKMAVILTDDIFKCIFLKKKNTIPIQISLKFVSRSPIDNEPALLQVIAWIINYYQSRITSITLFPSLEILLPGDL